MSGIAFHEIDEDDWRAMGDAGVTWRDIAACFERPTWCALHEALDPMGCWSLTGRLVRAADDCGDCEFRKPRAHDGRIVG